MSDVSGDILAALAGAVGGFFAGRIGRRPPEPASVPERAPIPTPPEALHDSLERLVRTLPVPMVLLDRNGYVKAMNGAAGAIFDVDAQRAGGRALIEVIGSVELERLAHRALGGEIVEGSIVLRKLAAERNVGVDVVPLDGESGDVLLFAQDRSKIVDGERVRRDFLADISHELRTPISSIRLMVETIQLSGEDPEAIRMFLPKVVVELERMTRMIEDLLVLARGESGHFPLHRTSVDLANVVAETTASFRRRAEEQEVELTVDAPSAIEANVDSERIRQVVANLVDNALRHTPPGGHVRVGVRTQNGEAMLQVRDDGVGIPFKDVPHVFERFYVVDRSRSRDSGGTGLGLAIVKQIVEAHGGWVHVDSELGSGATFSCNLPIKFKSS